MIIYTIKLKKHKRYGTISYYTTIPKEILKKLNINKHDIIEYEFSNLTKDVWYPRISKVIKKTKNYDSLHIPKLLIENSVGSNTEFIIIHINNIFKNQNL